MQFRFKRYDGEGGDSLATRQAEPTGPFDTLEEVRAAIRKELGGRTFGTFSGPFFDNDEGTVECWHESEAEGCGGYAVLADPAE